jgi:hypothetical protein
MVCFGRTIRPLSTQASISSIWNFHSWATLWAGIAFRSILLYTVLRLTPVYPASSSSGSQRFSMGAPNSPEGESGSVLASTKTAAMTDLG